MTYCCTAIAFKSAILAREAIHGMRSFLLTKRTLPYLSLNDAASSRPLREFLPLSGPCARRRNAIWGVLQGRCINLRLRRGRGHRAGRLVQLPRIGCRLNWVRTLTWRHHKGICSVILVPYSEMTLFKCHCKRLVVVLVTRMMLVCSNKAWQGPIN